MPDTFHIQKDGKHFQVSAASRDEAIAKVQSYSGAEAPQNIAEPQLPRSNDPRATAVDTAVSVGSSAVAEPVAGLAGLVGLVGGLVPGGESPSEKANRFIEGTRDFVTVDPSFQESQSTVGGIGKIAEVGTKAVRAPVAGVAGLTQLARGEGLDEAANTTRDILERGVGKVAGETAQDLGAPAAVSAGIEAIPTAIASALGLRAASKVNPRLKGVSDDLAKDLTAKGIDVTDASPQNIQRIKTEISRFTDEQQARVDALREVGIESPTRAQVTRRADDFQSQQELGKRSSALRDTLESQEGALSQFADDVVSGTGGKPVTSGSTVIDEVVGRSTRLDDQISDLYKQARDVAPDAENINLSRVIKRIDEKIGGDTAADGVFSSMKSEAQALGIVDDAGNIRPVTVEVAEEFRKHANRLHDPKNRSLANSELRSLKDAIDDDVLRTAGRDVFNEARKAKADFEESLSNAKISRFDRNNRSLVRDILENKVDPDVLVDRITSSKSYRARDLEQLRDFLQQTDEGIAAFDDLRAQVMQRVKDKSFIGPEDAKGVQALSRDKLQKSLDAIGEERLDVLFTVEERGLLRSLLEAAKIREPVRGTALGKGPSAQLVNGLNQRIAGSSTIGAIVDHVSVGRQGRLMLNATPDAAPNVRAVPSRAGLAVPAAISNERSN